MNLKYASVAVFFTFFLGLLVYQALAAENTIRLQPVPQTPNRPKITRSKPQTVTTKAPNKLRYVNKSPRKILPVGYCCKDGKISSSIQPDCQRLRGTYFVSKREAKVGCKGFCCKDGVVSTISDTSCREKKGTFFGKERDAEKRCSRDRGYCCKNGDIDKSTIATCKKERGTFYRSKKEATRRCLGYCNQEDKTLRLTEDQCKKKRGRYFTNQNQAKRNLLRLRRQELIKKKSLKIQNTGVGTENTPTMMGSMNQRLPDLTVRGVSINNKTPQVGTKVKVSSTIYNRGNKPASQVLVYFTYQGEHQTRTINRIANNKTANVSVDITIKEPAGSQSIEVYVNPNKKIKESDHSNNRQQKYILVKAPLKLLPQEKRTIGDLETPEMITLPPPVLPELQQPVSNIPPGSPVAVTIPKDKAKDILSPVIKPSQAITKLQPVPMKPVISSFSMTPSRWQQGKDYLVIIKGKGFKPDHWVRLSQSIDVVETIFKNSSTLEVQIKLADDVARGRIPIQLCTGPKTPSISGNGSPQCNRTSLHGWVVSSLTPLPVELIACDDLDEGTPDTLEEIGLVAPKAGFSYTGGAYMGNPNPDYYDLGVPLLDDQTEFQWWEQTTGLADSFEIQFLSPDEKILKNITINATGNVTTFKPDPQLIMELYKLVFGLRFQKIDSIASIRPSLNSISELSQVLPEDAGATQGCNATATSDWSDYMTAEEKLACYKKKNPGVIQLLWRVLGYKKINKCGVLPSGKSILSKEVVQVETSDFGYLRLGHTPDGTMCEENNSELTVSKENESQGTNDHLLYPGETIVIEGSFSLNNCPWHVDGRKGWGPTPIGSGINYIFNNVFIDWGDGTVKRLGAAGDYETSDNSEAPDFQSDMDLSFHGSHIYTAPGQYQARIFVRPTDDLVFRGTPDEIEARTFNAYCNPIDITIVQDIAATGPLHLKAINIVSLSSDNNLPPPTQNGSPSEISLEASESVSEKITLTGQQHVVQFANRVSTCDAGLWARAKLDYYGQGYVRLEWRVDGVLIKSEERKIGPSRLRKDLPQNPADWNSEPAESSNFYNSPGLPVSEAGSHKIIVSARIISDPTGSTVNSAAMQFQNTTTVVKNSYINLQQALNVPMVSMADSNVTSSPETYLSVQNDDPTCNFLFMVKSFGDYFLITNTSDVQNHGDLYSGKGTLIYRLPDTAYSVKEFFQPLNFSNWQATSESALPSGLMPSSESTLPPGLKVTQGHLETTAFVVMDDLPGMSVRLRQLAGEAGDQVNAVFDVTVKDTTLRLAGSEVPQSWTGLSATLTPEGDWYIDGQTMGLTHIGWSLFNIESDDVRIDLSHRQGSSLSGAKSQSNIGGTDWVGIHLGSATLYPYTFKLDNNVKIDAQNWGIMEGGLYGNSHGTSFDHAFGDGRIGWDSIDITVEASKLDAQYAGMFVEMAWPKVRLEGGETHLSYAPGENGSVSVDFSTTEVPHEEYGAISMTSRIKNFEFRNNWGINTDTTFEFFERSKPISEVAVDDIFFNIFSKAEFAGNQMYKALSISGEASIGGAPTTLNQIFVHTRDTKGALVFTLTGELNLAKIEKFDVNIYYSTEKEGDQILVAGPIVGNLPSVDFQFPDGLPVMKSKINGLHYNAGFSQRSGGSGGGCTANDAFVGTMATKLFNASTNDEYDLIFRYGEQSNKAYWLAYGKSEANVAIYPPYLFITAFKGGMAYNFPAEALVRNQASACPNDGGLVFSAGVDLSVLKDGVVTGDAILTVAPGQGEYRFDTTKLEILSIDIDTQSEYVYNASNDSFHGTIWGNFEPVNGVLKIVNEKYSNSFFVDRSSWNVSMGTKDGPKTGISLLNNPFGGGYLLNGMGYFEIGSTIEGFRSGINTDIGISSNSGECNKENATCIGAGGNFDIDFSGYFNPVSFSLDSNTNLDFGGCADLGLWSGCASVGAGVNYGIGINPTRLAFNTDIFPLPCVKVVITFHALPAPPYPDIGTAWTCWKPSWPW